MVKFCQILSLYIQALLLTLWRKHENKDKSMDSGLAHLIQKLNVKVSKIGSFGDQLDDPSLNPALV